MATLQGKWIWYELITGDDAGAKAFYEAVVGWSITPGTKPPMNYGMIANADGQMTGGLLPLTAEMSANGARPAWLGYIGVDDCDAALDAIVARGGKLLLPPIDLDEGRIAMVADPDGAPFYVMKPNMPEGAIDGSNAFDPRLVGRCGWNELQAGDQHGALDFYTALFGWALLEPMDMGPMGKYQFIAHDGEMIGAVMQKVPHVPAAAWGFYFRVADIDLATAATHSHGGQVFHGPAQITGGDWIINGVDPQGATFALVGAKPGG